MNRPSQLSVTNTITLTFVAMFAFAANSILCRLALAQNSIDPFSFTAIRLASGALMLALICRLKQSAEHQRRFRPVSSVMLFVYAMAFSLAYVQLAAGTGALLLFGAVQLTMIGTGLYRGERPGWLTLFGVLTAFSGLIYLMLPGVSAPPPGASFLMIVAGVAWGGYTLAGKGHANPLYASTWNFIGTLPMAALTVLLFHEEAQLTASGVSLAIASGAIASGLGYVIWYRALNGLSATQAASVQLSVPVLATIIGVLLLAEPMSWRLALASAAILGGIYLCIRPTPSQ